MLTSLSPFSSTRPTPDSLRALVRQRKAQGADVIKIFASASIRDGGAQTLSDEQLAAICGEAKAQGMRTMVHAHSSESIKASVLAGCDQIEHGVFANDETLKLMADHHVYFDPQVCLVFRNYLDNRAKYEGIGNYNDAGFAAMEKAIPMATAMFKRAIHTPGLKVIFGTDAVAGAHGRNAEELVCRVKAGGQSPIDAITSATSLSAESMRMGDQIGSDRAGNAGRPHRGDRRSDQGHHGAAQRGVRDEGRKDLSEREVTATTPGRSARRGGRGSAVG